MGWNFGEDTPRLPSTVLTADTVFTFCEDADCVAVYGEDLLRSYEGDGDLDELWRALRAKFKDETRYTASCLVRYNQFMINQHFCFL